MVNDGCWSCCEKEKFAICEYGLAKGRTKFLFLRSYKAAKNGK